jgi:subtilisin family serine protease
MLAHVPVLQHDRGIRHLKLVLGGGFRNLQGPSMAAPQVTGTAGIVASVTGLRGDALRGRLEGSVDDLGTPGYDTIFGWGRLNTYRAATNGTLVEASSTN